MRPNGEALLRVEDVVVHYPVRTDGAFGRVRPLRAVDGVSISLSEGEALGLWESLVDLRAPSGVLYPYRGRDVATSHPNSHQVTPIR